jgi:hypothetical protein
MVVLQGTYVTLIVLIEAFATLVQVQLTVHSHGINIPIISTITMLTLTFAPPPPGKCSCFDGFYGYNCGQKSELAKKKDWEKS